MTKTPERFAVIDDVAEADVQQSETWAARRFAAGLAVSLIGAVGLAAWLIVSTGAPDVSAASPAAAAADAGSTPQVPYFPSLYVNQATEVEPPPATF